MPTFSIHNERNVLPQIFIMYAFRSCVLFFVICLQCFDAVGWAAGRASGL